MRLIVRDLIGRVGAWVLAVLFLLSTLAKTIGYTSEVDALGSYSLVGELAIYIVPLLIGIECLLVVGLLVRRTRRVFLAWSLLFVGTVTAVYWLESVLYGAPEDCGCGMPELGFLGEAYAVYARNLVLVGGISLLVLICPAERCELTAREGGHGNGK